MQYGIKNGLLSKQCFNSKGSAELYSKDVAELSRLISVQACVKNEDICVEYDSEQWRKLSPQCLLDKSLGTRADDEEFRPQDDENAMFNVSLLYVFCGIIQHPIGLHRYSSHFPSYPFRVHRLYNQENFSLPKILVLLCDSTAENSGIRCYTR